MAAAWRRCKQGGEMQRTWTSRVSASIRSTEVTDGANGWHPHIHVALRTSEWSQDEQKELLRRWQTAVERHCGAEHVPDDRHGIVWSKPLEAENASPERIARYVVKLALELTDVADAKEGPWGVAQRATRGDRQAVARWREYVTATRGRRMIELDNRAVEFARMVTREHEELPPENFCRVEIDSIELQALRQYEREVDPTIMGRLLALVRGCDQPIPAVAGLLESIMEELRLQSAA